MLVSCAVKSSIDGVQGLSDVKTMVHKLYTSLNVDQHQVGRWGRGVRVGVWGMGRCMCGWMGEDGRLYTSLNAEQHQVGGWGGVGV